MTAKGFDIAVIGGGVIGLTLSRALLSEGARVAVIDAGDAVPPATHAAAGMLAPSFEHGKGGGPAGEALYRLGALGLSLWPDFAAALEEETGVFVDYRGHGALGVAYDEEETQALTAQAARVSVLGGKAQMISGDEARAMEPALSRDVIEALYALADAQVDPRRLTAALRASLEKKMTPHFAARVALLEKNRSGHVLVTAGGERIEAAAVVLASGAVSGLVARDLVFPVKGEAAAVRIGEGLLARVVRAPGAYLCPKAGGRLVIGASETRGPDDLSVDDAAIEALKTGAARAVPELAGAVELERWAGLRPGTPDGAPILGRDEDGRFLALGHYRNGVLHAPAAAAAMAALILGRAPAVDLAPFAPDRFTPGHKG
jgi:glycine oxidase